MRARTGPASTGLPWLVALLVAASPATGAAQEPSLIDVLVRATDYVSRYSEQLSGTVAEERYDQLSTGPPTRGFGRFPTSGATAIGARCARTISSSSCWAGIGTTGSATSSRSTGGRSATGTSA